MGKVALEGIEFYAYHGAYPEESVLGNRFTLDLVIDTDFREAMIQDSLEGTVDYAQLYQLIKSRMEVKVKLLEHLGNLIVLDILEAFPKVTRVQLTLRKHQPALGGIVNYSTVTVCYPEDFS
jgi:7,8-dihydroneopterin aldolase/epimerase/oxygenase